MTLVGRLGCCKPDEFVGNGELLTVGSDGIEGSATLFGGSDNSDSSFGGTGRSLEVIASLDLDAKVWGLLMLAADSVAADVGGA